MHVANIVGSGREVMFSDGRFTIQDEGPVSAEALLDYDRRGEIEWLSDELKECAHSLSAEVPQYPDEPVTVTEPVAPSPRGRWTLWIALSGVALLALLVGAAAAAAFVSVQSRQTRARAAATETTQSPAATETTQSATPAARALDSVGRVDAAVRTGVNFEGYSTLLRAAATAVAAFRPVDQPGTVLKKALARAVLYYRAASEAWELDLASAWWSGQDKPSYWQGTYPDLDLSAAGPRVTADQVRQAAWVVAGKAYADAKTAAGAYGR